MPTARITIFDTTLRDGEQSPGCSMNVPEKLRMAHRLDQLGVDVLEAGFPIASQVKPRACLHGGVAPGAVQTAAGSRSEHPRPRAAAA